MHLEELQDQDVRFARNETLLWKQHTEQFASWIKNKVRIEVFIFVIFTLI